MDEFFMVEAMKSWLPYGRRRSPKGWETMNCVMCEHQGKSKDDKRKGGIIFSGPTFTYRCFRCRFKTHWRPGMVMTRKLRQFLTVLGVDERQIMSLDIESRKLKDEVLIEGFDGFSEWSFERFEPAKLPKGAKTLQEWAETDKSQNPHFLQTVKYLDSRGDKVFNSLDFYWTPSKENQLNQRLIIPFYYDGEIVGWTGRYYNNKIPNNIPKYFSNQPNGYLFNNQFLNDYYRKYIILVEGPIDALSINGIAYMSNQPNTSQINWLKQTGKQIIVLPDRGKGGLESIKVAIENGWSVSFPDWDKKLKDANDAVRQYGSIWTLKNILDNVYSSELEIRLKRKEKWI